MSGDVKEALDAIAAPANGGATKGIKKIVITSDDGAGAKSAPKATVVEGEEHLKALSKNKTTGWSVERIDGLDVPAALLGVLPITLPGSIFADKERLASRLGRGRYRFFNGEKSYEMDLQTRQAPVEFGPEEEEDVVVSTPAGPVLARVPKSAAAAAPMMSMGGSPWGWGSPPPQQQSTTDIAKVVIEAMKPFMDLQTKMMEALGKKDDHGQHEYMLKIEQMKLDAAREDAKARIKEAEENRKSREAELKSQQASELAKAERIADANAKAAEATAKAQYESAKLQAETAKEQAKYAAEASKEQAKIMAESQKAVAEAQVESAKARADADRESLKAQMTMQREMYEKMDEMRKEVQAPHVEESALAQALQHLPMLPTLAQTILNGMLAIKAQPLTLVGPAGADGPKIEVDSQGQMKAIPAKAEPTAEAKAEAEKAVAAKKAESEAAKKQLLDTLATLASGADRDLDATVVAAAIKEGAPRIHAWLKQADPMTCLAEIEKILATPDFSDADRAQASIAKTAIVGKIPWLMGVVTAIKGAS